MYVVYWRSSLLREKYYVQLHVVGLVGIVLFGNSIHLLYVMLLGRFHWHRKV